ncbi:PREDICTED: protogenin-like [Priapulus caudatus]|uniref:Protogenin-like n=1 Tax=Priapulus caudatus TaxID=37621 RepID=A0ABM1DXE7_PRICU|nr:PREDICTED: protogenin-like [Priapulus caudatus]
METQALFTSLLLTIAILGALTSGVAVGFESSLAFVEEPHDVVTDRGQSLVLNCSAHARNGEPVNITWRHNGERLIPDQRRVSLLRNGSLYFSRVISRRKGRDTDAGYYECLARSKIGAIVSRRIKLTVAGMARFSKQPESQSVEEGGVVRFECQIKAVPKPVITWEKNDVLLPQNIGRYTTLSSGVLQIDSIVRGDAGRYRCVASNSANQRQSSEAELSILPGSREPQLPKIIAASRNVTRVVGETAELECLATGNPAPDITWTREGTEDGLPTRHAYFVRGNLRIDRVNPRDVGIYVCTASSGDKSDTAKTELIVHVKPKITKVPSNQEYQTGKNVRFICEASGVPAPTITWLRDGRPVKNNGRMRITAQRQLVVSQSIANDSAIYQCVASNVVGTATAAGEARINISEDEPDPPEGLVAYALSSTGINVTWDPSPPRNGKDIIAYSLHYTPTAGGFEGQKVGYLTTLVADELEPYTNYTFYVVAYNRPSASRHSKLITVMTDEDVPKAAPSVSLTSVNPTTLDIAWDQLSAEMARGDLTQYKLEYREHDEASVYPLIIHGGDKLSYRLTDLTPKVKYDVRILAGTSKGFPTDLKEKDRPWVTQEMPDWSASKIPPPSLHLSQVNGTTLHVVWEETLPSLNISGYKLSYTAAGRVVGPLLIPSDVNQWTLNNLEAEQFYEVRLLAYRNSVDGLEQVKGIQLEPTADPVPLIDPTKIKAVEPPARVTCEKEFITAHSIKLSWKRPLSARNITLYTIRYNPVGTKNASLTQYIRSKNLSEVVAGLAPNTRYEFAVKSHDDRDLVGPYSNHSECWTLEAIPGKPLDPACILKTPDTISITWMPPMEPNGDIIAYCIWYTNQGANLPLEYWSNKTVVGTERRVVLDELKPSSRYWVKVQAETSAGAGEPSKVLTITLPVQNSHIYPNSNEDSAGISGESGQNGKLGDTSIGIIVGVAIGGGCILVCAIILLFRNRCCPQIQTVSSAPATRQLPHTNGQRMANGELHGSSESHEMDALMPMLTPVPDPDHDTKGGNGQVVYGNGRKPNGILPHTVRLPTGPVVSQNPASSHNQPPESLIITAGPKHSSLYDIDLSIEEQRGSQGSRHSGGAANTTTMTTVEPSDLTGSSEYYMEGNAAAADSLSSSPTLRRPGHRRGESPVAPPTSSRDASSDAPCGSTV